MVHIDEFKDIEETISKKWIELIKENKIASLSINNIKTINKNYKIFGKFKAFIYPHRANRPGAIQKLEPHNNKTCPFCAPDTDLLLEIIIDSVKLYNFNWRCHYNFSPFVTSGHFLWLPLDSEPAWYQKREQKLLKEDIEDIYKLSLTLHNQLFFYNSPGAAASRNHIHIQSVVKEEENIKLLHSLSFKSNENLFKIVENYPALIIKFEGVDSILTLWKLVDLFQEKDQALNIIWEQGSIYFIPRNKEKEITQYFPRMKIGAWEMIGNFILTNWEDFNNCNEEKIKNAITETSLNHEQITLFSKT